MFEVLTPIFVISTKRGHILNKLFKILTNLEKNPPPSFSMEYLIFAQISKIFIKFLEHIKKISYNVRGFVPNFRDFNQKWTHFEGTEILTNFFEILIKILDIFTKMLKILIQIWLNVIDFGQNFEDLV